MVVAGGRESSMRSVSKGTIRLVAIVYRRSARGVNEFLFLVLANGATRHLFPACYTARRRAGAKLMFCPGCGATVSDSHKFCKSCGTNLEQIQAALAGRVVPAAPGRGEWTPARLSALRAGIATLLSGVALGVFLFLFFDSLGFAAIGAFPFAAGAAKIINTLFFSTHANASKTGSPRKDLPPASSLPGLPDYAPPASVTEQTTRLITEEKKQEF